MVWIYPRSAREMMNPLKESDLAASGPAARERPCLAAVGNRWIAAALAATCQADAAPRPVLRRLMFPITAILIALVSVAACLLWWQQELRLRGSVADEAVEDSRHFRQSLDQQTRALTLALQPIAADPFVIAALRDRDHGWPPVPMAAGVRPDEAGRKYHGDGLPGR